MGGESVTPYNGEQLSMGEGRGEGEGEGGGSPSQNNANLLMEVDSVQQSPSPFYIEDEEYAKARRTSVNEYATMLRG